jgi:hypothetical protein
LPRYRLPVGGSLVPVVLEELSRDERVLLLKFVCAFAWADLEIRDQERDFVGRLIERLDLDEEEHRQVAGWLKHGIAPEEVDPNRVPRRHREIFLRCAREIIVADGTVDPNEEENYELLKALLK